MDAAEEEALDAAWSALDEGRSDEVLERLSQIDGRNGERAVLEVYLWLERIDWKRAEGALERARELVAEDEPMLLAARAEWELAHWQVEEARALFEAAAREEPSPRLFDRLAVCADFVGDFAKADAWLREAYTLDPVNGILPARLSEPDFDEEVKRAIEDLPPEFQSALEEIAILVDPMPEPALVEGAELEELPLDLLGLFVGPSALDRSHDLSAELPPRIYLFQRNLERICADTTLLREEIRVTLYHELGHALGFDEDGVEEMGLE